MTTILTSALTTESTPLQNAPETIVEQITKENGYESKMTPNLKDEDPCDKFDCHVETIPGDICTIPVKGPFDLFCFIPCMLDNCTKEVQPGNICFDFICTPKPGPGPTPPGPGPTPPGPGPTPPGPGPTPPGPGPTPPGPPPSNNDAVIVSETIGKIPLVNCYNNRL